jgi:hypothetical protein
MSQKSNWLIVPFPQPLSEKDCCRSRAISSNSLLAKSSRALVTARYYNCYR